MMRNITYAYKQAPWRKQLQGAAWVLVVLVIFVMIAIAYLGISAKTYAAGIAIQSLQSEQEALSNEIADLHNKLGSSTSYKIMTEKASKKGYEIISDSSRIVYLEVPGYVEPSPDIDIPKDNSNRNIYTGTIIKSVYTPVLMGFTNEWGIKVGR